MSRNDEFWLYDNPDDGFFVYFIISSMIKILLINMYICMYNSKFILLILWKEWSIILVHEKWGNNL